VANQNGCFVAVNQSGWVFAVISQSGLVFGCCLPIRMSVCSNQPIRMGVFVAVRQWEWVFCCCCCPIRMSVLWTPANQIGVFLLPLIRMSILLVNEKWI
jgi:hypothetical protein